MDILIAPIKLLYKMIQAIQLHNSNALALFKLENPTDSAMLSYYLEQDPSEVKWLIQSIKLILIHCTQEQGLDLINAYQEKLSGFFNETITNELKSYLAALKKVDVFIKLNSELAQQEPEVRLRFFLNPSQEKQELSKLLTPINAKALFYFNG